MMYLTRYAKVRVNDVVGRPDAASRVIAHGIDDRFRPSREPLQDARKSWRLVYVSAVDLYKHQWHVIDAVRRLQTEGHDVELRLVGPCFPEAARRLRHALESTSIRSGSVAYLGAVKHAELHRIYQEADIFVYASSCENLPNILLEAMRTGRPIACSFRGPMPEVLRDGGVFFDPENSASIADAIRSLIDSPELRRRVAELAVRYAGEYSWERCARESFDYLADIATAHRTQR